MGYKNHELFIRQYKAQLNGPFLEIGAKDYGSTINLRELFPGETYVGIDMEAGKGVDLVLDMTKSIEDIDRQLEGRRFGTIFCLSVLEHCAQPFLMAENITRLLVPGGRLYVSVPYAWKFHGYPSDYWRFTQEGVKKLFPEIEFDMAGARASTDVVGDIEVLDENIHRIKLSASWQYRSGHLARVPGALLLSVLGWLGVIRWLTRHRYLMPPTCIEMLGVRKPD